MSIYRVLAIVLVALLPIDGNCATAAAGPSAEEVVAFLAFGLETGRPDWFPSRTPGEMIVASEKPFTLRLQPTDGSGTATQDSLEASVESIDSCKYKLHFKAFLEKRGVELVLQADFSNVAPPIKRIDSDAFRSVSLPGLAATCQSPTNDCRVLGPNELGLNGADQGRLTKALAYLQAHFCAGATGQKRKLPF